MLSSCVGYAVLLWKSVCNGMSDRSMCGGCLLTLTVEAAAILLFKITFYILHNDQTSFQAGVNSFYRSETLISTKRERFINYCSEISTVELQDLVTVYFWYDKAMMGLMLFALSDTHSLWIYDTWQSLTVPYGAPVGSMNVLTDDKLTNILKVPQKLTCRWYSPGFHEGLLDRFVHKLMFVVVICVIFVLWNANLSL